MGKYYDCLTGIVRCIEAPNRNKYGLIVGVDYDIIDGDIQGLECNCDFNAVDLEELNWYFEREKIKFVLIESGD